MALQYERINRHGTEAASVTGCDEQSVRTLFVLPEISETLVGPENSGSKEMLPVREIAAHALEGKRGLEEVSLPETIEVIRPFAFHSCPDLHILKLHDSVVDFYDGAVRQCNQIEEIEITFHKKNRFHLLKDMVNDSDQAMPFLLHFPAEEGEPFDYIDPNGQHYISASLTFPSFADNYEEDTFSRSMHEKIEGSGYAARQHVSREQIDFLFYDRLFPRLTYDEPASAVDAAFRRLMYPYRLTEEAEEQYRTYLYEHSPEILPKLIRGRKEARFGHEGELIWIPNDEAHTLRRLHFLCGEKLIRQEAIGAALQALSEIQNPTFTAVIMEYQYHVLQQAKPQTPEKVEPEAVSGSPSPQGTAFDSFDLDEL